MKKLLIIALAAIGSLQAKPTENAVSLIESMKLVEKYSKDYGTYRHPSGSVARLSPSVIKALPSNLKKEGLLTLFAEHIDRSLSLKEIEEALTFYRSATGQKLSSVLTPNKENYSKLDMIALGWGSQRADKIREILHLQSFGGEEAMLYVKNLRNVVSACQQFMLEEGKNEATYLDVVGTYFKEIEPINGESYKEISVTAKGGKVSVTNADGKVFEYKY